MALIYESPDNGKTVYARESGSTERTLVREPEEFVNDQVWVKIRNAAKTNVALNDLLTKAVTTYKLIENEASN